MKMWVFAKAGAWLLLALTGPAHAAAAASAAEGRSYTADLATMYNEYQRLLAVRDACMTLPGKRDETTKIAKLLRDSGVRLADSRLEITTRHPDHDTAKLLEYSMAGSLVCMRRWRTDVEGKIVTAGNYLYRGDLFVLDIAEPFAGIGPARTDFVPGVRGISRRGNRSRKKRRP